MLGLLAYFLSLGLVIFGSELKLRCPNPEEAPSTSFNLDNNILYTIIYNTSDSLPSIAFCTSSASQNTVTPGLILLVRIVTKKSNSISHKRPKHKWLSLCLHGVSSSPLFHFLPLFLFYFGSRQPRVLTASIVLRKSTVQGQGNNVIL